MKSFLGFLIMLFATLPLAAEKKQRAVFAEYGATSNSFSVCYDSRFHGNRGLGYSVGLGYGGSDSPFSFWSNGTYLSEGVSVPLEINAIMGGKKHLLDIGAGLNLGYYQNQTNSYDFLYGYLTPSKAPGEYPIEQQQYQGKFGYFCCFRMSYRYQAPEGLFFRIGLAYLSGIEGIKHSVSDHPALVPHIGFGLSF